MFGKQEPDVLVAGAGPVGLFAAICLRNESARVQVVDKERRPASHSYALALHPATQRLFAKAGLDPDGIDRTLKIDSMAFHDRSGRQAAVHLDDLPEPFPFVRVVRQSTLEQWLERELRTRGTEVEWRHRLAGWTARGSHLEVDLERLDEISTGYPIAMAECEVVKRYHRKARFLLGADGHRSAVRRHAGLHSLEMGPPQLFGVFEFECRDIPTNEIRVVLDRDSTNVLWPLPDGRCRWSFQLDWADQDDDTDLHFKSRVAVQVGRDYFPQLDEGLLAELIRSRAPWFDASIGTIYWSVLARFERRLVDRFGEGRVWLAGDAAHLTGPVGMQSMNVGLREASDLAACALVADDPGGLERRTRQYGSRQAREWRTLLGVEGVRPSGGASSWVRENWERILPCLPASGRDLQLLGEQIGLDVVVPAGSAAGEPAPQ
ncbi:FAD-dependent monooxygenase [bacterium]|nr:FAD-dependent monooxygenase [bacterium]